MLVLGYTCSGMMGVSLPEDLKASMQPSQSTAAEGQQPVAVAVARRVLSAGRTKTRSQYPSKWQVKS